MDRVRDAPMTLDQPAIDAKTVETRPVFFYNLTDVQNQMASSLLANPDHLKIICEQNYATLQSSDVTIFTQTGFYLIINSVSGDEAFELARRINLALLKLFFGTNNLTPEQMVPVFRIAAPEEVQILRNVSPYPSITTGKRNANPLPSNERWIIEPPNPGKRFSQLGITGKCPAEHVALNFVPVYDILRGTPALYICTPTSHRGRGEILGRAAFRELSIIEAPYLDEAVLRYAAAFSDRLMQTGSVSAVCVPVSAETLSWSRGRRVYLSALRDVDLGLNPQIIPLIEDISPGTPPNRLADMISVLRPYARRIAIVLPDSEIALDRSGIIGASGFSLPLPPRANMQLADRLGAWLSRNCKAQNAFSCVTGVNSEDVLDALRDQGVRFASGSALAPKTVSADAAITLARTLSCANTIAPDPVNDE